MLVHRLVAPLLGASCCVISDGGRCVVVDPGGGAAAEIRADVAARGLTPLAVLITHGHVDHVWDAGALADGWGVPAYVHEADAYRLADPFGTLGPMGDQLRAMVPGGAEPLVPRDLRTFAADADGWVDLDLASLGTAGPDVVPPGLRASPRPGGTTAAPASAAPFVVRARHLPGHTEGSTVYLVDAATEDLPTPGAAAGPDAVGPVALTGDVLFAGSIGRTDLPGGDHRAMTRSLGRLRELDPATLVIPGHGPTTTIRAELATNPYL